MESLQSIKQRIRGVQNINQITKAMELVAATKMRRSQEVALHSRPYAYAALDLLMSLVRLDGVTLPPLLQSREVKRHAYVVVTSDKGLAGSFNSAVLKEFDKFSREDIGADGHEHTFIAVGQKSAQFLEKKAGGQVTKFLRVGDYTTPDQVRPIAEHLMKGYLAGKWDEVTVFSTHFRSALKQEVLRRQILPVNYDMLRQTARDIVPDTGLYSNLKDEGGKDLNLTEYIIEPTPAEIIGSLAEHLVMMEIYHLILEANASEHAARRMAMKNASDNAEALASELTMEYNKSRQAAITKEITEIVAGAESLK